MLADVAAPAAQLTTLVTRRVPDHGPWARFQALLREIDEPLYAEIAERRADPDLESREDILSALVAARFEDGSGMDDSELRDQLMTLLLAGHETTATALAWSFDMLLRHPAQLARLREELADGGEEYLRATITEVAPPAAGGAARRPPPRHRPAASTGSTCRPAPTSRRRSG